mmetsp:Transcript_18057/g.21207  ORF Transcript_18057/g.21207 Transcript_18057/m.21207 type:complete len:92 (+) Transcript_18057:642-917(+)
MRWFLTPIALLSWANLNHTLCGTDGDPFWLLLGLGKWYYPLAEIYLGAAAIAFIAINFSVAWLIKRVVLGDRSCSHGVCAVRGASNDKKSN